MSVLHLTTRRRRRYGTMLRVDVKLCFRVSRGIVMDLSGGSYRAKINHKLTRSTNECVGREGEGIERSTYM